MSDNRPNLLDLVDELEPLDPSQRQLRLSELGLPPDLRRQVERCLRSDAPAGDFLQRPPVPEAAWASFSFGEDDALSADTSSGHVPPVMQIPGYEITGK